MFKNIFFDTKKSNIHLWEQFNGQDSYTEIPWVPYVFDLDSEGEIHTIDGKFSSKHEFDSYEDYYSYQSSMQNIFENNVRPEIQFLAERYSGIPDEEIEIPKLKIYSLDIECYSESEFPTAQEAKYPIVLISVYDSKSNSTSTFSTRQYSGQFKNESWLKYFTYSTEEDMLYGFFSWFKRNPCDVITGWNVIGFDLQYIINRAKYIFGEDTFSYSSLSPIKRVKSWYKHESYNMDIAGITILDYMDLYKWYSPNKLERYTLDFVSKHVLGKGKLDYSKYNNLTELYKEDWNLYVDYNITDALRVGQMENELGYIKMVQSLSLLTKAPMKHYNVMNQLIEGMFLTYFRRNKMCAPYFAGGTQESYPAAIVKEPVPGLYEWVVDLDITSSYPSHIITLNMSTETYYGRIKEMTEDEVVSHVRKGSFPPFHMSSPRGTIFISDKKLEVFNRGLSKKLLSVAPCGTIFVSSTPGIISTMERYVFEKRSDVRSKIRKMRKSLPDLRNSDLDRAKNKITQYNSLQLALKVILNAAYGITATPYSRYFNKDLAEAIVSCGRHTIKSGENFVNKLLNQPPKELQDILDQIK